jgi:hypothetical protein
MGRLPLGVTLGCECFRRIASDLDTRHKTRRRAAPQRAPLKVLQSEEFGPRFPGSSMVEHSAVNRRVASSNLARGATFSEFLVGQRDIHFTRQAPLCDRRLNQSCSIGE